jgi:hypothetical protein
MLNGMGRDRGAASALEQAILPATVPDDRRTWTLAWYNLVLDGGHAVGALAATTPTILMRATTLGSLAAHQFTFLVCAGVMLFCIVPSLALSGGIEIGGSQSRLTRSPVDPHSKRVITRWHSCSVSTASVAAF